MFSDLSLIRTAGSSPRTWPWLTWLRMAALVLLAVAVNDKADTAFNLGLEVGDKKKTVRLGLAAVRIDLPGLADLPVAWRRTLQGVLIANNQTPLVTVATIVRMLALVAVLLIGGISPRTSRAAALSPRHRRYKRASSVYGYGSSGAMPIPRLKARSASA